MVKKIKQKDIVVQKLDITATRRNKDKTRIYQASTSELYCRHQNMEGCPSLGRSPEIIADMGTTYFRANLRLKSGMTRLGRLLRIHLGGVR